jgi:hypothetical protein
MRRRLLRMTPAGIVYGEIRTEALCMSLGKRGARVLLLLLVPLGLAGLPARSYSRQPPAGRQNPQASTWESRV